MKKINSVYKICLIALAVVINIVGGNIALWLHLPIYLDSMGTILIAILLGPFYGMLPNVLSGFIFGLTTDIYSLYYAPVGIMLGFMTGMIVKDQKKTSVRHLALQALWISIPVSLLSACITTALFGGITSSGSTVLVQLLAKTPLGLMGSCFVVQFVTDYIDRLISLWLMMMVIQKLPSSILMRFQQNKI